MSKKLRDEMMERRLKLQHSKCYYCGIDITMKDHLDHLLPVYYGGQNLKKNLVAACKGCNLYKKAGTIEISNPYTIEDYLKLQDAYKKWRIKVKKNPTLKRWQSKRVRLYGVYHAECFKKQYYFIEITENKQG